MSELGFEYCSYVLQTPFESGKPNTTWSSTYPRPWLEHYFANNYLSIDTLIRRVVAAPSPIVWSDDVFQTERSFWEAARSHQIRHGWGLATHGKYGTRAVLSLARSSEKVTERELESTEGKLVWLAHSALGLLNATNTARFGSHAHVELTPREREVLRWTSAGKTTQEIGIILGISERAVTFHVSNCLVKLNVANKTQAVSTATLLDLLF